MLSFSMNPGYVWDCLIEAKMLEDYRKKDQIFNLILNVTWYEVSSIRDDMLWKQVSFRMVHSGFYNSIAIYTGILEAKVISPDILAFEQTSHGFLWRAYKKQISHYCLRYQVFQTFNPLSLYGR